ncbi:MAG: T9SS type A sorting domain-containing protein [Bacteroidetes bacterium]|nr:T9SS type A sorting domain-containing protein [Bacteroidota bacterium]
MKFALLSYVLLAGSLMAHGQASMLSDINPGTSSSNPSWLTGYNNRVLFVADNGVNGSELYAYDTAANIIYDNNPGSAAGALSSNHRKLALIGSDVYFAGDNGATGTELFKWNNTGTPTLIADIRVGAVGSFISELISINGKLYFNANNGTNGNELWSYDPATSITQRLTDLATGAGSSDPHNFIYYKNKLYFTASTSTQGMELFVYDPANNTTNNALDIFSGSGSSDPQGQVIINDKLYFSAYTLTYGRELYSYDGTNVSRLTDVDNSSTDGVAVIANGQSGIFGYNGKIYFSGNNGSGGYQLYSYNPSNGVTSLAFLINPGGNGNPSNFTSYAAKMFFTADDGTHGNELWSYDGNQTILVADIDSGANSSAPVNLLRWGTKLYFSANVVTTGRELFMLYDTAALAVQNVSMVNKIKVFPNPTTGFVTVTVDAGNNQDLHITVADITGKLVYQQQKTITGQGSFNIDLRNEASGLYLYRLTDANGKLLITGKIEKQ